MVPRRFEPLPHLAPRRWGAYGMRRRGGPPERGEGRPFGGVFLRPDLVVADMARHRRPTLTPPTAPEPLSRRCSRGDLRLDADGTLGRQAVLDGTIPRGHRWRRIHWHRGDACGEGMCRDRANRSGAVAPRVAWCARRSRRCGNRPTGDSSLTTVACRSDSTWRFSTDANSSVTRCARARSVRTAAGRSSRARRYSRPRFPSLRGGCDRG